jgi:hypothetical protein
MAQVDRAPTPLRLGDPGSDYRAADGDWFPMVYVHRAQPPLEPGMYVLESLADWMASQRGVSPQVVVSAEGSDEFAAALADRGITTTGFLAGVFVVVIERSLSTLVVACATRSGR